MSIYRACCMFKRGNVIIIIIIMIILAVLYMCVYIYIYRERERDRCICIIRIRVRLRMMIILFDDSDTISGRPTESCMYIMCVCIPTQKHFARSYNRHVFGMIMYMLMIIN